LNKKIRFSIAVVLIVILIPSMGIPFFRFLTGELHYKPHNIGLMLIIQLIVYVLALMFLNCCVGKTSYKLLMITSSFSKTLLNAFMMILAFKTIPSYLNQELVCSILAFLSGLGSEIVWIPIISFSVRYCPKGLEATFTSFVFSMSL